MRALDAKTSCLAAELNAQFADSGKLDQAIKANLRGLDNGR